MTSLYHICGRIATVLGNFFVFLFFSFLKRDLVIKNEKKVDKNKKIHNLPIAYGEIL